ncbi:MAG: winged helix-turn-helix domain-containing protein [Lachnospiraceae bacterium]|nr:winged helix-turn-helix domain-containing protein [Lachnospiraceae bacterium]
MDGDGIRMKDGHRVLVSRKRRGQQVQMQMSRLRRKLNQTWEGHCFIETVWGQGYRSVPPHGLARYELTLHYEGTEQIVSVDFWAPYAARRRRSTALKNMSRRS